MTPQREMFHETDHGLVPNAPCQQHSPESRAAAEAIRPHLSRLQGRVLQIIRQAGMRGITDIEGSVASGIKEGTYRARRIELMRGGWIRKTGIKRGNAAAWVLTRGD